MNVQSALTGTMETVLMSALVVICALVIRRDVAIRLLACMTTLTLLSFRSPVYTSDSEGRPAFRVRFVAGLGMRAITETP